MCLWFCTREKIGKLICRYRATVMESSSIWYKDDGTLTKVLCTAPVEADNPESIPTAEASAVGDCCACGTAKYQLSFRSVWSQSGDPHDVSDDAASLPHWSPVVGSSHSKHYTMWRFDTMASRGVRDICQFGDTRALEDEIRHQVITGGS